MPSISDKAGPHCESFASGEDGYSGNIIEWGEDVDLYEENFLDAASQFRLIERANRRVLLQSVLDRLPIQWEEQYNILGWTHKCCCPFPDHDDKTPSFGFNSKEDRFYCFGCQRSGRAVQFISIMESRDEIDVARDFIVNNPEDEDETFSVEYIDFNKIEDLLLDYADYVREFKQLNGCSNEALKYAEAISWNLDLYLRAAVPVGNLSIVNLEARIELLKEELDCYGEPE